MREHNLLQLADDSAILAENRQPILGVAFHQVLDFSDENIMFPNVSKFKFFLPLSDNADNDPIVISDSVVIRCAKNNEDVYLGMKFVSSIVRQCIYRKT